ncbi:MAG: Transcriptional regulator, LysR family [uncultured Solirubrobacteraceae bacterium]|uniref:Transcriptional regulator, LysR family n=1 Tax=uncultured Solirubrobacteraceae bacterium TaxID=1162706 RepID=A0A6J4RQW4_9ACTN|nr:MAG: Transcriptional regulator, LysR family [uncultured Solirubrobacteraceae bacterium]
MELRHLRYFVAVAEELHFHRAAERLHISQPPLSQQIRALETELGVQLLERNRRSVALTAAGAVFLSEVREILAAVDAAAESARSVARGEAGRLALGFVGSAMHGALPGVLRAHRRAFPQVELVLTELPTAGQLEALRAGRIDVGVIRPPVREPGLALESIHTEPFVVALPEEHGLAARREVALADLVGEPFVLLARREAPGLHESLEQAMADAGGVPRVVQEAREMQTVVGLVAAGLGVSLVPASVGADQHRGVAFRPVAGSAPTVELALAWRPDDRSPVLAAFLATAREEAAV